MASENGKFKVGDRVRRVKETDSPDLFGEVGKEYTVLTAHAMGIGVVPGKPGADPNAFELVPAWQPKVGDRVRSLVDWCEVKKGETYAVVEISTNGLWVAVPGDINHYMSTEEIEPAPAATPAAFPIEAGRYYKTRDGRKVGPIRAVTKNMIGTYRFRGVENVPNGRDLFIPASGEGVNHGFGYDTNLDLVALWEEPVAASNDNAAVAKPKFKVGDVVEVVRSRPGLTSKVGKRIKINRVTSHALYATCEGTDNMVFHEDEVELAGPALDSSPAIVALIENGTPRPSTAPKVHTSQEAATTEAERLALENPGQQFGVFVLADSKIADLVTTQTAVLRAA